MQMLLYKESRYTYAPIYLIYIYIHLSNLRLRIAVFVRKREQGYFKGSSEEARGSTIGQCRGAGRSLQRVQQPSAGAAIVGF